MRKTAQEIHNLSNGKALKRARELRKLSRIELARMLDLSPKTIEKYENGRKKIEKEDVKLFMKALNLTTEQFKKIKKGKGCGVNKKSKKVVENTDRRSYQKLITKECKVLKSLRRMKRISQDDASKLCGYSRPTIGHIENGRIELSKERIKHIVKSYGYDHINFEKEYEKNEQRDEIIEKCINKLIMLSEEKLNTIKTILESL